MRFTVQPPTGKAKSGQFCWWTVHDTKVDLTKHGNNITDYFYDGYPDAQQRAEARAAELNAMPDGALKHLRFGVNHPNDVGDPEGEFARLYAAA